MGETVSNEKAPKKSFIKGLKVEFKKIIWPDKATLTKQTGAVLAVSVVIFAVCWTIFTGNRPGRRI